MKLKALNSQKLRFVIIGAINTGLDFGLLLSLTSVGLGKVLSNTISTGAAFIFSFFANKNYTFRSKSPNFKREVVLFTIVTLFGLWVLQNGIISYLAPYLASLGLTNELSLIIAKLIATIASLIWNYLLYDKVVFPKAKPKPLHAVIDARILETSTGRYVQRLLENLNDNHAEDFRYSAIVPSAHVDKWQARLPHIAIIAGDQKPYSFGEQFSLPFLLWRLKPGFTHFTMPQQPFLWFGKSVTTIHDTTLLRYSNVDGSRLAYAVRKTIFSLLMHLIIRRSQEVIVPTEFVKNDLSDYFGKRFLTKMTVTLEAGEIPDVEPEPIKKLVDKDFLFFVGNAFPYKNIKRLIDATNQLHSTHPQLYLALAGKKDYFYNQLADYVKQNNIKNIKFLGFISDGEKRWAMQHARAFVTASLSEGFCIPLLEAMIEGAPVVASDASCLPEVTGDSALLFDPHSTDDLVATVIKLLSSNSLATKLKQKGKTRASQFSWQKMTDQTVAVYQKIQ